MLSRLVAFWNGAGATERIVLILVAGAVALTMVTCAAAHDLSPTECESAAQFAQVVAQARDEGAAQADVLALLDKTWTEREPGALLADEQDLALLKGLVAGIYAMPTSTPERWASATLTACMKAHGKRAT